MRGKVLTGLAWAAVLALGVLLAMVGSAYADQGSQVSAAPAAASQGPQLSMPAGMPPVKLGGSWYSGLLLGVAAGVQAVFVGMMKKQNSLGEFPSLNYKLLAKTLVVGVLVGVVAQAMRWSPSDAAAWVVTAPIGGVVTAGVEDLINLVWRKLSPPATPAA